MKKHLCSAIIALSIIVASKLIASEQAYLHGLESIKYYTTQDSIQLRTAHFIPQDTCIAGHLLLIQGRGTFIEYYEEFIKALLARSLAVWTFDLAGQGGSTRIIQEEPKKQHIESFDAYLKHLEEWVEWVETQHCSTAPLMITAYSTGGHIALRYLQENPGRTQGAWIISPLIGFPQNNLLTKTFLSLSPWIAPLSDKFKKSYVPGSDETDPIFKCTAHDNGYTSDPQGYEEIHTLSSNYENFSVGGATIGWMVAAIQSSQKLTLLDNINKIEDPVMISIGSSDTVVDSTATALLAAQIKNCHFIQYPRGKHELFREASLIRKQLWQDFDRFLELYLKIGN